MEDFLLIELEQLEAAFLAKIKGYLGSGASEIELARLFAELDFFGELQAAGLSNILTKAETEYTGIVNDILTKAEGLGVGVGGLDLKDLGTIADSDYGALLGSAEVYTDRFRSSLLKGFLGGQTTTEIIQKLDGIGLKTNQLIAAVNTARDEFQATTTARIFEDNPDQRFKLTGPLDGKTRCQCSAVLRLQPKDGLTKAEIDAGAWTKIATANCPDYVKQLAKGQATNYTFINRGGYNCRHWNEPV